MTLGDIYTKQVLNNLAMFIQNPDALPFFGFPNQGTTQIQDTGTIGGPGYSGGHFMTSPFDLNASQATTENWVLVPVTDPAKLATVRCAYRQAIASCIGMNLNDIAGCPDCRGAAKTSTAPRAKRPEDPVRAQGSPASIPLPGLYGVAKSTHVVPETILARRSGLTAVSMFVSHRKAAKC